MPAARTGQQDAGQGRLRRRGPVLGGGVPHRGPALLHKRGGAKLYRLPFRDGLGLYHHRGQHTHRHRGHAHGALILAQFYPLAGGHGCAGVPFGGDTHGEGKELPSARDARRESRTSGGQAGAEASGQRKDTLCHIYRPDTVADSSAAFGRDAPFRQRHHRLRHGGHRRLWHKSGQPDGLQPLPTGGLHGVYGPVRGELQHFLSAASAAVYEGFKEPGAAFVPWDNAGEYSHNRL